MTDRADYIAGLRALADILEAHDDVPLPYEGNSTAMSFHFLSAKDPKGDLARMARIFPGPFQKEVADHGTHAYFDLIGNVAGLKVRFCAYRDAVCERVVVAKETVTRKVPDPSVDVPEVEVTEEVERVEWRCSPLLEGGESE